MNQIRLLFPGDYGTTVPLSKSQLTYLPSVSFCGTSRRLYMLQYFVDTPYF